MLCSSEARKQTSGRAEVGKWKVRYKKDGKEAKDIVQKDKRKSKRTYSEKKQARTETAKTLGYDVSQIG